MSQLPFLPNRYWMAIALSLFSLDAHADKSCSVSATLAFGAYDPLASTNLDTIGTIDFYCNSNTSVVLKLGLGNGAGASYYHGRRMTAIGGSLLIYNIYTDSLHTHVLGDGSGGSVTLRVEGKFAFSRSVYGLIPALQKGLKAANYSDILLITIVY